MIHARSSLRAVLAAVAVAVAALCAAPAAADGPADPLFEALREAGSQAEADALAARIWQVWLTAPDPAAQAILDAAMRRRQALDLLGALAELDRLVAAYPDYAEGWNQRATLHFLRGDYPASLADVAEVLAREPRHFGALAGKAVIHYRLGDVALAQLAVRNALKLHPYLRERAILDAIPGTDI